MSSRTMHVAARARSSESGFTILEIVVVLAVLAAIGAIIAPNVLSMLTDANHTRAQADAARIASAVSLFREHTGLWPYENNTSAAKVPAKEAADFDCLYGPAGAGSPTDGTAGTTWTVASCDTIENHLIENTPVDLGTKAYVTTGKNAWRGPYLQQLPPDPWGNRFMINIGKGDPALSPKKAVFVISAGPNAILETSADALATSIVTPAGDDVIERIQ